MKNDKRTFQCTFETDFDEVHDKEMFVYDLEHHVLRKFVRPPRSKYPVLPVLPLAAEKIKGLRELLSKTRYACFEGMKRRPELHIVLSAIILKYCASSTLDLDDLQRMVNALYEKENEKPS